MGSDRRRPREVDFAIVSTPWGIVAAPPGQELWFEDGVPSVIRLTNLSRDTAEVVVAQGIISEPDPIRPEPEGDVFELPKDGQIELRLAYPPPRDEFVLEIVDPVTGYRARAGSDPRVRIRG
jgi:hypothetical protein